MRAELVRGKRKTDQSRDLDREEREDSESENSDMEDQDASEQCRMSDSYQTEEGFFLISKGKLWNYNSSEPSGI